MTMSMPHLAPAIDIKINGEDMAADQFDRLTEVSVEQCLHLPSMCTLRLHDVGAQPSKAIFFQMLDADSMKIGAELELSLGREGPAQTVFNGEITSVELDASTDRTPRLVVRAYDRGHRLLRGRHSR